jgi:hypothetical protein
MATMAANSTAQVEGGGAVEDDEDEEFEGL